MIRNATTSLDDAATSSSRASSRLGLETRSSSFDVKKVCGGTLLLYRRGVGRLPSALLG